MAAKIFVVTGANKGIGKAIVESFAQKLSKDDVVYLTARNPDLGTKTLNELAMKSKPKLRFHQLDITNDESCKEFASHLDKTHGGFDVLINNAGVYIYDLPEGDGKQVIVEVNYYGTKRITEYLLPLIRKNGRIINVCSTLGQMPGNYSEERIQQLKSAKTVPKIDQWVKDYESYPDFKSKVAAGFPSGKMGAYRVSKSALIAFSIVLAQQLKEKQIDVNACCPGYCNTDMTRHMGHLSPEGAKTPVLLAVDNDLGTGNFWFEQKITFW